MSDSAHGALTPKQDAFVTAYLETGNATEASKAAGLDLSLMPPTEGAYVYFLTCPAMEKIIYVGKGRGDRMRHHMREVRTGRISGHKKHKAIRTYIDQGKRPLAVVFASGLTDTAALSLEKATVFKIGPEKLSNTLACTGSKWDRGLEHHRAMMSRVKPFCQFIEEVKADPIKVAFYGWWSQMARENGQEIAERAGR